MNFFSEFIKSVLVYLMYLVCFSKLSEIAEPGIVDESRLSVPRQVRRSVQNRTENSRYSARRRSSKEQEFEGMTSQSENERSASRRKDSVIKSNRFIR